MNAIGWSIAPGLTDYGVAVASMEARADAIARGEAPELIWLVEHPPVYTAGTSAAAGEHVGGFGIPVVATGRGGRFTYHGPGQRVIYAMLDLNRRGRDVRRFVAGLEAWGIAALARLGVEAFTLPGDTGIWTRVDRDTAKIGAIGIRLRRWVSFHGMAINVAPDLAHFGGIIPCGIADRGVTSLSALGIAADMPMLDAALKAALPLGFAGAEVAHQDA